MARLLGLDPALAKLGYALVEFPTGDPSISNPVVLKMGVVTTEKSDKKRNVLAAEDVVRRVRELGRGLTAELGDRFGGARVVCAEAMSFPRNASAAAKVAMAWGLVVGYMDWFGGLPLCQASPQEVKRAVCCRRDASKEAVEAAMRNRFVDQDLVALMPRVRPSDREHAYDALAVVMTVAGSGSDVVRAVLGS